ncbi:hypothetical protein [Cesiribacter andamanensis]|uniref:GLPGLI family protein n=1 Tax=Cesiribacter andamanensis AMV16 TaxID=1279009 RepID=M7N6H1_9BACT|nr:hypothetical protein [Cesiribacter andamanensis]EMR04213.1 hypothetical protein ADICEAN_00621 [Cesiribacter andamanensis AMV16]
MRINFIHLLVLFLLIGVGAAPASAQQRGDLWFKGMVELETGQRLQGAISYYSDFKAALLQIRTDGRTLSYDANQVVFFRFYDDQLGITRTFYSLPFTPEGSGHEIMLFFETLLEGGYLTALSKTEFRTETRQPRNPYMYRGHYIPSWYDRNAMRGYSVVVPYETIYLVTPDSHIEAYNQPTSLASQEVRFRKPNPDMLMQLVRDKRSQVDAFISQNKLDVRKRQDLLRVVQYYNEIKDRSN